MKRLNFLSSRSGIAPDLTSRQSRSDSLSIVSRQSVLATLLLCLTLFVGVGSAWGTEYTYTEFATSFKKGTTYSGTSISSGISTSTKVSTIAASGSGNWATNVTATSNCYYNNAGVGVRISKSSGAGTITLTLSDALKDSAIYAIVIHASKVSGNTKAKLDITPTAPAGGYTTVTNIANGTLVAYSASYDPLNNYYKLDTIKCSGKKINTLQFASASGGYTMLHRVCIITQTEKAAACANSVGVTKGSESHGEVTTIGSASVATCSGTASDRRVTITVTPDDCYDAPLTLTWTKSSGTVSASKQSGPTPIGDGTYSYVYQFAQNDNGAGTFGVTCTAKAAGKTVNFDAGPGSCHTSSLTETCDGSGVTLPAVTATGVCKGWTTFAGWATAAVSDSTTTSVTVYSAGSKYTPASNNMTLYAVYSKTKGGGSGFKLSLNSGGTDYYVGAKGSGSYMSAVTDAADAVVFTFANGYLSYDNSGTKTYISSEGNNTTLTVGTSVPSSTWTESGTTTYTYQSSATGNRYLGFNSGASPVRFAPYGSTYAHEFTKHSLSTTYYCSDPNCCTPLGTINGSVSWSNDGTSLTVKNWGYTQGTGAAESNISKYTIYLYSDADSYTDPVGEGLDCTVANRASTGVTFNGLNYARTYKVKITATPASGYCPVDDVWSSDTYKLTCATPTAATAGSFARATQKMPISWTSGAGKVDICYSSNSSTPAATPGSGYTVVSNQTSSPVNLDVSGLAAGNYYCWVRSVCDASNKSSWTAITGSTFTIPAHTLTITKDGGGTSTITPASGSSVVEGRTASITASPATGYAFDHWAVSGTNATLSSTSTTTTTFTMGTANATVTGYFTCVEPTFTVHPASKTDYLTTDGATALGYTASAAGASLTQQWQVSTDNSNWDDIAAGSGGTAATYTPDISTEGTKYYRVIVTNSAAGCSSATATSNVATIRSTAPSGYCISVYNSSNNGIQSGFSNGGSGNEYTLAFTVPGKDGSSNWPMFWIGENNSSQSYSNNDYLANMHFTHSNATLGLAEGATGTLHIWDNNKEAGSNLWVKFEPDGYGLRWGGADWSQAENTKAFTVDPGDANTYWTELVTLDGTNNTAWSYYVGLKTATGYVYSGVDDEASDSRGLSRTRAVTTMKVSNGTAGSYKATNLNGEATGTRGKFRIWDNNITDYNFVCHFVPFWQLQYNSNGGSGSMSPLPATPVCCEASSGSRTVTVATSSFTAPQYKQFDHWNTASNNSGSNVNTGSYTLTGDVTLYAQWADIPVTALTLNHSSLTKYVGESTVTLSVASVTPAAANPAVTWTSSDDAVASVTAGGVVTFKAAGTATITATSTVSGGVTATCSVVVRSVSTTMQDTDGTTISGSGLSATWTVGTRTLAASEGTSLYKFKRWVVTNATPASTTNATTTLGDPTGDVTVVAEYYKPITVTWKVGTAAASGSPTTEVKYGTKISTLPSTPADGAISSCGANKFMGWTAAGKIEGTGHSAPADLFTTVGGATTLTENTIYRAVFATHEEGEEEEDQDPPYTHTITSKTWDPAGDATLSGVSWTLADNGSYYGYDGTKGQQVGSGTYPASSMTLSTSGISGKIKAVKITTSGASSVAATVAVSVGSTDFTSGGNPTVSISAISTEYTFTGSATGTITISWTQTSSKALYFKAIEVDYATVTPTSTDKDYITGCCTQLDDLNGEVTWSNATTAVVSWDDIDHVDSWTVKYKTHAAVGWSTAGASSTSAGTRSVTISSLTPCTDYDFQIIATPAEDYCNKDQTIEDDQTHAYSVDYSGCSNVTKTGGGTTACGSSNLVATFTASLPYELPESVSVTIGGAGQTQGTDFTWAISEGVGTLTIGSAKQTGNIVIDVDGNLLTCNVNPTIGTATLDGSGTFNLSNVAVSVTGCSTGSAVCDWTDYGFVWGTSANPTGNKTAIGSDGTATSWSGTLTGSFSTGVTYYYRAYGKNSKDGAAIVYGSDATFIPRSVTFNSNGGSNVDTKYVASGGTVSAPVAPNKDGYTFGGWYTDNGTWASLVNWSSTISADVTYYAKWNTITYYITYEGLSGASNTNPEEYNIETPTITLVDPGTREGWTFAGWTCGGDPITQIAVGSMGDKTITATWTINQYNVAVDEVDGVTIHVGDLDMGENADVNYGTELTLAKDGLGTGIYWVGWKVTNAGGDDVTASVVSENTLTVPAYDITVTAVLGKMKAWCMPEFEITGDIHLTSVKGVYVNSTSTTGDLLTLSGTNTENVTAISIDYLDNNGDVVATKKTSPLRLRTGNNSTYVESDITSGFSTGTYEENFSVRFAPTAYDELDNYKLRLTIKKGSRVLKTIEHPMSGRALPEEFVIAVKRNEQWYALPNTILDNKNAITPIQITVNEPSTPTAATFAPTTTVYKGYETENSRYAAGTNVYGVRLTDPNNKWLQVSSSSGTNYVWVSGSGNATCQDWWLSSSDFSTYTLKVPSSGAGDKSFGINNRGNIGFHPSDATNLCKEVFLLPITNKYAPVEADATDWTGDAIGVTASTSATKLGIKQEDGTETSPVTLHSAEASHVADFDGDIDFTALTGNTILLKWYDGESFIGGSEVTVPSIVLAGANDEWSDFASAPTINDIVVLSKPMTVDEVHAKAKQIVIDQSDDNTGKLTVQANKGLEVAGTVKVYSGTAFNATEEADLVLESSSSAGNASLIFNNSNACQATVQQYSKAAIVGNTWNWQYVGTPFAGSIPQYNYYGSWMYKWDSGSWYPVHGGDELTPFAGYCLTQESATTHVMGGTLVATDGNDQTINMAASTDMVLANSWTAPISIASFDIEGGDATFSSTPATVYLFNTGSAKDGSSEGTAAGTYIAVPINSAPYTGNGLIAPMQGFFVTTYGGSAGTIKLKYDELVRPAGEHTEIVAGPMKAPRSVAAETVHPDVMKIHVDGSIYTDRVIILAREDFSQGFDNGWDGEKKGYNSVAPAVFVINEEGKNDAVSAIPTYEGTVVGFRAGTDDAYTIRFEYNGEETLYLNDLKEQVATPIDNARTYNFTTEAGDSEVRFIISATPIAKMPTGIDEVQSDNGQSTTVRKLMIHGQLYIIRGGRIFSAEGHLIK